MPLSDVQIRNAKPTEKPYKLTDGGGLYLFIQPHGAKLWRLNYRFQGKQKTLAIGAYPHVTLSQARARLAEAKRSLAEGIDPGAQRKADKLAVLEVARNTFEAVALEWQAKQAEVWTASHSRLVLRILNRYLFPAIGARPVAELSAPEVLRALRPIETRGALETAHRARTIASQVMRFGIATGRCDRDPAGDLRGALSPLKVKHHPTITDPARVGELLRAIDGYSGTLISRCALRLLPLVFTRPGELRAAEWAEIDLAGAVWEIPASKMKMRADHIVPLSSQALAILAEIQPLTGSGKYVFPSERSAVRPMSENTINAALRRLGYSKDEIVGHGFRAMARTLLDEKLGFRIDLIEHQLAHEVKDPLGRAYNRTKHLEERGRMMQAWADYLDTLKAGTAQGANVVQLRMAK
jgi:integrase